MIAPTTGPVIQNGMKTKTNRPAMPNRRTAAWLLSARARRCANGAASQRGSSHWRQLSTNSG